MNAPLRRGPDFPLPVLLRGETFTLQPLAGNAKQAILQFAKKLPEEDLLFLDRDITQSEVVDHWLRRLAEGNMVTIAAWKGDEIVGYASFDRGSARWTRHVAELRVVVAESARGIGLGRFLLELIFEMSLAQGITKLIARMTPDQVGAKKLFETLGFEAEALLRDHALDGNDLAHDLLCLCYHAREQTRHRCGACGIPVLNALSLDGMELCSHCFELRYEELGAGD